jgi:hypothetical protein
MKIKGKWRVASDEWRAKREKWLVVAREDDAGLSDTHRISGGRRDETGTLLAEPWTDITAYVTLCQVRNKDCGLNGLRGCNEESGW